MRAAVLALLALAACGDTAEDRPPPAPPTVLLLTLDTTRADRLGCYGDASAHTPRLDALAAAGLRCERAYAPAPITLPAHATLLTGTDPVRHGLHVNAGVAASSRARLLSEALSERGFVTAAFVGSFVLDARFGLAQGFDTYRGPAAGALGLAPEVVERPANEVADEALAFIAQAPADRPLFLWVHFYDPHQPLRAPQRLLPLVPDAYAAEIAFCDEQAGRLLDALAPRSPLVLVVADHGEALGEHGEATHGVLLHDATMRVPLLLAGPGVPHAVLDAPVGAIDVAVTLLDALGLPPDLLPDQQGLSLVALAREARPAAERALLLETQLPWQSYRWHPLDGVVAQGHKLVEGARVEVFALDEDPDELRDVSAARPEVLAALRAQRDALLARAGADWAEPREADAAESGALEALGYVGGGGAPPARDAQAGLPDPRDRLPDLALTEQALGQLRRGRLLLGLDPPPTGAPPRDEAEGAACLQRAAELLQQVLSRYADDPNALANLGLVQLSRGRHAEAEAAFERHAALEPRSVPTRVNLALCYAAAGRDDWAEDEMRTALSLEPRFLAAAQWLAERAERADQRESAAFWLRHALDAGGLSPEQRAALVARVAALGPAGPAPPGFPASDLRTARARAEAPP
jgi:choline-sulfatase